MNEHEKTREFLIDELKKEIIGPEPLGEKKTYLQLQRIILKRLLLI